MTKSVKDLDQYLATVSAAALKSLGIDQAPQLLPPPRDGMGYLGFACFPYARQLRKSPPEVAQEVRAAILKEMGDSALVEDVTAEGPFLNFKLSMPGVLGLILQELEENADGFGGGFVHKDDTRPIMIEYSSPNTNKPQHLGHIRNNLLGQTVANIMEHYGYPVVRTNLINDRGIHICKSMLAYQDHGNNTTPEESGIKGDHLIGNFYVKFNTVFTAEYKAWLATDEANAAFDAWKASPAALKAKKGWAKKANKDIKKANKANGTQTPQVKPDEMPEETLYSTFTSSYKDAFFNTASVLGGRCKEMLRKWEAEDPEVRKLWRQLNDWVEAGFHETYQRMGIHFDNIDFESETYLLGKDLIQQGLADGVFGKADNGAVVFDLSKIKLQGQKAVLRPDGTSLYTTQDLGTATRRFEQFNPEKLVYVVGDEQNHHFKVLFGILAQLDANLDGRCHHLSYGMVNLPHGRMKSREGTVVDADDLMDEVVQLALGETLKLHPDLNEAEAKQRAESIGLGALKFFLMDYTPQTTMIFNPEKSLEVTGRTGVYAMYSYARVASIMRKGDFVGTGKANPDVLNLLTHEKEEAIIKALAAFPQTVKRAFDLYDPSKLTEYTWKLGKSLSSFYEACPVLTAETEEVKQARFWLIYAASRVQKIALSILGIHALEEM